MEQPKTGQRQKHFVDTTEEQTEDIMYDRNKIVIHNEKVGKDCRETLLTELLELHVGSYAIEVEACRYILVELDIRSPSRQTFGMKMFCAKHTYGQHGTEPRLDKANQFPLRISDEMLNDIHKARSMGNSKVLFLLQELGSLEKTNRETVPQFEYSVRHIKTIFWNERTNFTFIQPGSLETNKALSSNRHIMYWYERNILSGMKNDLR